MSRAAPGDEPLLVVRDLRVGFPGPAQEVRAVDGLSLELRRGEALALVGQSGSGKSATAMTLLGLTRFAGARVGGSIRFAGRELAGAPETELRRVRGDRIAMVFQEPATALDPVQRIGRQIAEQLEVHGRASMAEGERRAIELLEQVRLPRAREVAWSYPFELSGGMRQRALIAMAISCEPELLIADEPTAALDAVTQAEVLSLIDELRRNQGMAVLLATHDLRAVARIADRLAVVRAGRVVDHGPAEELLHHPRHEHTRLLLRTPVGPTGRVSPARDGALLEVRDLVVHFRARRRARFLGDGRAEGARAVEGVTLELGTGETLGLVGPSGCGKTTLARAVLRLVEPQSGSIRFQGRELTGLGRRALRPLRRELQAVFQDPAASLNPRRRVGDAVGAPLRRQGARRDQAAGRARELLERVELPAELYQRFPHELSGGQRQRVAIARALALEPRLVVLDEPVSALDAPVRAQVLDLLVRLQRELRLGYLLISHDLDLVARVADRVAVMDSGAVVEEGSPEEVVERPRHPAAQALAAAACYAAREPK